MPSFIAVPGTDVVLQFTEERTVVAGILRQALADDHTITAETVSGTLVLHLRSAGPLVVTDKAVFGQHAPVALQALMF